MSSTSLAGSTIDRYAVEALIGRGGMGEVYRAVDDRLRRKVALKVLRPDKTRPDAVARLFREARAAAALTHPNAVAIHDIGEDDGLFYIVMELVSGVPLLAYVGDERVSIARKLRWLIEIGRALQAAHRAGILHRDVKPANVMISEDDIAKVLDFGLAKPVEPQSVDFRTQAGRIVGTVRYMAPEQLSGSELDPRVDQYSFGITAYELLGGRYPGGRPFGVVEALETIAPQVPPDCARIIERTMQQAPRDRFASMADVVTAFEDVASSRPLRVAASSGRAVETAPDGSGGAQSKAPSTPVMPDTVRDPNRAEDTPRERPVGDNLLHERDGEDLTVKASPRFDPALLEAAGFGEPPASDPVPTVSIAQPAAALPAEPADDAMSKSVPRAVRDAAPELQTMLSREAPSELKLMIAQVREQGAQPDLPKGTMPLPIMPAKKLGGPPTLASGLPLAPLPPAGAMPAATGAPLGASSQPGALGPAAKPAVPALLPTPGPTQGGSLPPPPRTSPPNPPLRAKASSRVGVILGIGAGLVVLGAGAAGTYLGGRDAPARGDARAGSTSPLSSPTGSKAAAPEAISASAAAFEPAPPLDPPRPEPAQKAQASTPATGRRPLPAPTPTPRVDPPSVEGSR